MTNRTTIRNLHSGRPVPPRFCDAVVEGEQIYLERKKEKGGYDKIPWDDVVYQVEALKTAHNVN